MNFTNPIKTAAALASATVFAVCAPAQDDVAVEATAGEPAAEQAAADDADLGLPPVKKADTKYFHPLIRCKQVQMLKPDAVQVLKPRSDVAVPAEEGRYYPLGSTITVTGDVAAPVVFEFGDKAFLRVSPNTEFATKEIKIGEPVRTLVLKKGRVEVVLPLQLKEGLFKVVTPGDEKTPSNLVFENLAGESRFDYSSDASGEEVVARCVTGTMGIVGKHFKLPRLVAANQVRISTTGANLFTSIYGESGDCKTILDQGILAERNFETGDVVEKVKELEFVLSPQCSIKIFRARSKLSGRMAVSMMTFDSAGVMKNRVAFAEGLSNVNSDKLVVSTQDADKAAAKNKADEETETVEVKTEKEEDDEVKKEEKKSDDDDDLI